MHTYGVYSLISFVTFTLRLLIVH